MLPSNFSINLLSVAASRAFDKMLIKEMGRFGPHRSGGFIGLSKNIRYNWTIDCGNLIQFLEWISLPDYLTSAFRIRYNDSCMDSNFNPTPLSSGCLNEIEIFILTLMLAVFLCAIISSIYYCFLANTQFRLISRSFKGMIFK